MGEVNNQVGDQSPITEECPYKCFEEALEKVLGEKIRQSDETATALWSALANVSWSHSVHGEVAYSFREGGALIAEIIGEGNYMDWYCSGPYPQVSSEIAEALSKEGWTFEVQE